MVKFNDLRGERNQSIVFFGLPEVVKKDVRRGIRNFLVFNAQIFVFCWLQGIPSEPAEEVLRQTADFIPWAVC